MPFTFSHPAAVLPLTYLPNRWISLTGLVAGSLAPDFEYFLRMRVYSSFSHSWSGLFWFDLPLAIILAFVFHFMVRDCIIDNLPDILNRRLSIFKDFNWLEHFKQNFLVVAISVLVGSTSHIVWDDFTHEHGVFVQSINALQNRIVISGYSVAVYKILQHSSTVLGGMVIAYALLRLPTNKKNENENSIFLYWLSVGTVSLAITSSRLATGLDFRQYGNVIVTIIAGGLIGLVLAPKLMALRK